MRACRLIVKVLCLGGLTHRVRHPDKFRSAAMREGSTKYTPPVEMLGARCSEIPRLAGPFFFWLSEGRVAAPHALQRTQRGRTSSLGGRALTSTILYAASRKAVNRCCGGMRPQWRRAAVGRACVLSTRCREPLFHAFHSVARRCAAAKGTAGTAATRGAARAPCPEFVVRALARGRWRAPRCNVSG